MNGAWQWWIVLAVSGFLLSIVGGAMLYAFHIIVTPVDDDELRPR